MAIITRQPLPRRTFLKGMGAMVALPYLDAMAPLRSVGGRVAAAADPARLLCLEMVHGAAGCSPFGRKMSSHCWTMPTAGRPTTGQMATSSRSLGISATGR